MTTIIGTFGDCCDRIDVENVLRGMARYYGKANRKFNDRCDDMRGDNHDKEICMNIYGSSDKARRHE